MQPRESQGKEVNKQAVFEFESAARQFMVSTLRVAKSFRPKQLWGFYLFPDCYNHDYSKNKESYTGQCPDVEKTRTHQLAWLWRESMALYPSIYLDLLLASPPNSRKFVRARVMEAMRISQQHHDGYSLPVFVYTRPTYIRKLDVLSQLDLISTIGESAALGAAGAIFWGDADYTKNRDSCQIIKNYLEGDLGRYIVNVTTAAQLCSTALCQGRGRCLRQDSTADVFLHLNSTSFQLRRRDGNHPQRPLFWAEGQLSLADTLFLRTHFHQLIARQSPGVDSAHSAPAGPATQRNKELWWLWESSRALYPSIYLPPRFTGTNKALAYVRHRVAEAFAVQRGILNDGIPVLPYSQIAFDCTVDFLSQVLGMRT
ncbi:PREDICTED: hyaluronidase-2-like [Pygoscelis adeliae]|uniref:hyaluronidase-2-like n=1 Tax=Pygoscelis adeliae TaxID=9238 RepID=UPI0004F4D970|nr:PREDICTED: hyaluronidase-2-like [Pygoscelis adeliae]